MLICTGDRVRVWVPPVEGRMSRPAGPVDLASPTAPGAWPRHPGRGPAGPPWGLTPSRDAVPSTHLVRSGTTGRLAAGVRDPCHVERRLAAARQRRAAVGIGRHGVGPAPDRGIEAELLLVALFGRDRIAGEARVHRGDVLVALGHADL